MLNGFAKPSLILAITISSIILIFTKGWAPSFVNKSKAVSLPTRRELSQRWDGPVYTKAYSFVSNVEPGTSANLEKIILWRGEGTRGYSMQFRHLELSSALSAVLGREQNQESPISFKDALSYTGVTEMSSWELESFKGAMQYVTRKNGVNDTGLSSHELIQAASRCSLVRAVYEIVGEGEEYEDLAQSALANGSLQDLMEGGKNYKATWRVRLRQYGASSSSISKEKRFGKNMRSPLTLERQSVERMASLLVNFGGEVRLVKPDCTLYIFEGLHGRMKILARLLTKGPETSIIAPRSRLCITNTPLCPIAAYNMCNLAMIQNGQTILDPYAGSCTSLLAAAMIAPKCQTVGIEIAHNGQVNRENIRKDFSSRNLTMPVAIIRGDSTDANIRQLARNAIKGYAFDAIVTDPPYGRREKNGGRNDDPPLVQLVNSIAADRNNGTPLLKQGGRLVAFVPCVAGDDVRDGMPSEKQMAAAGIELLEMQEQPLNDVLSRWLVSYVCVE